MYYNNKKLVLSICWIVLGAALTALSLEEILDSSLCAGMGGGLIAVGALQLTRNLRYRKDPHYRRAIDTAARDERNRFLRMKSWSWAGYITILIEGVGAVLAMALGQRTVQMVLSCSVCLLLFVYWSAYLILRRKY